MGRSAIVLREKDGHSSGVDRRPEICNSCLDGRPADRSAEIAGDGGVLSTTSLAEEKQATTQILEEDVDLRELWFALSHQQRVQFGGHFSEMLLRAVQHHTSSTCLEPEPVHGYE